MPSPTPGPTYDGPLTHKPSDIPKVVYTRSNEMVSSVLIENATQEEITRRPCFLISVLTYWIGNGPLDQIWIRDPLTLVNLFSLRKNYGMEGKIYNFGNRFYAPNGLVAVTTSSSGPNTYVKFRG